MSRIAGAFATAKAAGKVALIPYLTAGDPSADRTVELAGVLQDSGADLMELGVPFSDPLADGAINQRSAARALAKGMNLSGVLDVASRIRRSRSIPLILFTYFNPVHKMGVLEFAARARDAGVDGVLVTDLPVEEGEDYRQAVDAAGMEAIFLAAPTTGPARIQSIGKATGTFVYYVSRTGVTGEQKLLPSEAKDKVLEIRRLTGKKVAVGFGVSRREHVEEVAGFADGVVIGSTLMKVVEEAGEGDSLPGRLEHRFRELLPRERHR
ncbi:MAG: tryptophan synthase subunit alpha [Acidobacteria bacterium]|nr:tryptophan synthase subunit alpha [Acidobacteriota bacterium]